MSLFALLSIHEQSVAFDYCIHSYARNKKLLHMTHNDEVQKEYSC